MTLTLRCQDASLELLPERGGLLRSLALVGRPGGATQLLWLPGDFSEDESGWPGGGLPVLFPFAGRVFHEGLPLQYALRDHVRSMPLHGFAYGLPWTVTAATASTAELQLTATDGTRELYPFNFVLTARYELTPDRLKLRLTAKNLGATTGLTAPMPVAMGLHPYFRVPLATPSSRAACVLETTATRKIRVTPTGAAGKAAAFPETLEEAAGRLSESVFANLILGDFQRPQARIVDHEDGLAVTLDWDPEVVHYVVLWNQEGQGFHCVEPWMGLPDAIANGQGLRWLAPDESVTLSVEIGLAPVQRG